MERALKRVQVPEPYIQTSVACFDPVCTYKASPKDRSKDSFTRPRGALFVLSGTTVSYRMAVIQNLHELLC